ISGAAVTTSIFNGAAANQSIANAIVGSSNVVQFGDGTLTLSGNNTYTGGTTLSRGTLAVSSDANLGATSGGLTFFDVGGTLRVLADVTSARGILILGESATFDTNGNTLTLSGSISSPNPSGSSLIKNGAGTLVLSTATAYSNEGGSTTING